MFFRVIKKSFIFGVVLFLCAAPFDAPRAEAVLNNEDFDPRKLAELEQFQSELVTAAAQPETATEGTSGQPAKPVQASQPGVQIVSEADLQKPPEVIQEQFRVISRKKTLLERIAIAAQSSINYDSNIFREKEGQDDFFYRSGGGVELDVSDLYKDLGFVLSYRADWNQYFSFSRLNHLDQSLAIDLPGYGKRLRIGKKLTVGASAGVGLGGGSGASSQDQGVFSKNFQPYARIDADYILSRKFSTDFAYNFALRKTNGKIETASGEEQLSSDSADVTVQEHDFQHRLKYHVTPKTFTFAGVGYGFTSSSGSSENVFGSKYFRLTGGLEGRLTPKSTVSFESGWEHRTFDSGSPASNSLYLKGAYLVQFTRKWSGRVLALRDTQASLSENSGLFTTTAVSAGLSYRPTQKWFLSTDPFFRYNEVDNGSSPDSTDVTGSGEGQNNYTFGIDNSIRYYVRRWLALHIAYRFENRRAQQSTGEYVDHLATVGVDVGPFTKWRG